MKMFTKSIVVNYVQYIERMFTVMNGVHMIELFNKYASWKILRYFTLHPSKEVV